MKKTISIILLLTVLMVTLPSCRSEKLKIEDCQWQMRYVMHVENGEVAMDAVREIDAAHPNAKIINMTLSAANGTLTLTDETNGTSYEGSYSVKRRTPDGIDYEITVDGIDGYATVAMTTYADGTQEPTLPINLGEYSMCFYAD